MSAIITSKFRLENALSFKNAVANAANSYYIFLGKSDTWSSAIESTADAVADIPKDCLVDENDAWQNMSSLKRLTAADVISIVPRHNWVAGNYYVPWDDADVDIFTKAFYVITDDFRVYKCIKAGLGAASTKPTATTVDLVGGEVGGDGYVWKYMTTITSTEQKFLTTSYMPIVTVPTGVGVSTPGGTGDDVSRYNYQIASGALATNSLTPQALYNGAIYRIVVDPLAPGVGYDTAPTVIITGSGTGATATAVISPGGVVTAINVTAPGTGYSVVNVTLTGGTPETAARARAILSPKNGHGTDPVAELGGFFVGLSTRFTANEGENDFIIGNSFRQIGIVKNPRVYGGESVATTTTLSALNKIQITSSTAPFSVPSYIVGGTSGARAFIDSYNPSTGLLTYHQNDKTGYTAFQYNETIYGRVGSSPNNIGSGIIGASTFVLSGTPTSGLIAPETQRFSGSILFLENRAPINRSASQIEDIKMIVEF